MNVIILDEGDTPFTFQVIAEITKKEDKTKYLYIQKINYDEHPFYVKEINTDNGTEYEEIVDDAEYIRVENAFLEATEKETL